MTTKKHRLIVYGVAVHLLLIAIVCYAAFPVEKPEEPIRLMYQTATGKVLFDHQTHTSETRYVLSCFDCHHRPPNDENHEEFEEPPKDEDFLISCGKCHMADPEEEAAPEEGDEPEKEYGPAGCLECHDAEEATNRADALHGQCSVCHFEYGKGPVHDGWLSKEEKEALKAYPNKWVDCGKCHVPNSQS